MRFLGILALLCSVTYAQFIDSTIKIDSIDVKIRPVFYGVTMHTALEAQTYDFLNQFHFSTKPSLIVQILPFKAGDSLAISKIDDGERYLRTQPFLADAKLTIDTLADGQHILHADVQDKWTLNPYIYLNNPAGSWDWGVGLIEYNLLGVGWETGLIYKDIQDRRGLQGLLGTPNFLFPHQRVEFSYSDYEGQGHESYALLNKPLVTLDDEWAWSATYYSLQEDLPLYVWTQNAPLWQNNNANTAFGPPPLAPYAHQQGLMHDYQFDSAQVQVTHNSKLGPVYLQVAVKSEWKMRIASNLDSSKIYQNGTDTTKWQLVNPIIPLPFKEDWWNGMAVQLQVPNLVKLTNYHRLKWTEDVDLGWKFGMGFYKDFKTDDGFGGYRLTQGLDGGWQISQNQIWTSSIRHSMRIQNDSLYDGHFTISSEYQYHPLVHWSWVINGNINGLWNAIPGENLSVGGYDGLSGTPQYAYIGRALAYGQMEMRYFPGSTWEFGSLQPAFSTFVNAANAWNSFEQMDARNLNYNIGIGLRLGATKSVQGVINRFDLSWPIYGQTPRSFMPQFSIIAALVL